MSTRSGAGYGFVPLPPQVHRIDRPHAAFDRRAPSTLSGEIEVVLEAEQPIHVGAGAKAVEGGTIVRQAAVIQGQPGIPGSTLKGVLRSRFEAITKSCSPSRPTSVAQARSQTHADIEKARLAHHLVRSASFEDVFGGACRPRGPTCPACALFGCVGGREGLRGRVTVCDFRAEEGVSFSIDGMPPQFAPRLHHVGRSSPVNEPREPKGKILEVTSLHGRKFAVGHGPVVPGAGLQNVETIPRKARVRGTLRIWCLTAAELGGLLGALGSLPTSALKVGAGKGHGFGRMCVVSTNYRLEGDDGAPAAIDEHGWRSALESSDDWFGGGEAALLALHAEDG